MDDEKDTLLSVLKNDKNHLPVKESLQESKQEKPENHRRDSSSPREPRDMVKNKNIYGFLNSVKIYHLKFSQT